MYYLEPGNWQIFFLLASVTRSHYGQFHKQEVMIQIPEVGKGRPEEMQAMVLFFSLKTNKSSIFSGQGFLILITMQICAFPPSRLNVFHTVKVVLFTFDIFYNIDVTNGVGGTFEPVKVPLEQSSNKLTETNATVAATSEPSTSCGSGEFKPATECDDCVVTMPEQPPSLSVEDVTATATDTEPEQEDFRTAYVGFRASYGLQCIVCYEKAWNTIHSGKEFFFSKVCALF